MDARNQRRALIAAAAGIGLSMSMADASQILSPTGLPEMRQLVEAHPEIFKTENKRLGILPGFGMLVGGPGGPDVSKLFAATTYTGNGGYSQKTIGVRPDLVWIKARNVNYEHALFDRLRGIQLPLDTSSTGAQYSNSQSLTAFNANGFDINSHYLVNNPGTNYVAWSFAEAERFFDIVSWNGTSAPQTLAHNLKQTPGLIIIKSVSGYTSDWRAWHRSLTSGSEVSLNTTGAESSSFTKFDFGNDSVYVAPTSTNFTVGTNFSGGGASFIAYLFAHDPAADGIVQCGSYVGNGLTGASGTTVTLGWKPQYLLIKRADSTSSWFIMDDTRGDFSTAVVNQLYAESSAAENGSSSFILTTSTGFQLRSTNLNNSASTWIYLAIRKP